MAYLARPFDASRDREALLSLWRENLSDRSLDDKLEARFRWLYEEHATHALRTFLVVDGATDEVVGCSSLLPHTLSVDGTLTPASIGVDLAITKKHRIAGPAVLLQRAVVSAVSAHEPGTGAFCFAYPNDGALPIVKRVGYKPIAVTSHGVKPVRTGYKIAPKVPFAALKAPASFLGDIALAALDRARLLRAPLLHRARSVPRADERFDALFDDVRRRVRVLGDRRSAFLNWRYTACPTRAHTLFAIFDRSETHLLAYAIYTVDGHTAVLVDCLAADEASTTALFVHLASHARALGLDSIYASYVAAPAFTASLAVSGFFPRGAARQLIAFIPPDAPEPLRSTLADGAHWQILDGELDL